MPLFSSKFAFKKSSNRRISSNAKILVENEIESEEVDEDDENTINETSQTIKSKSKIPNTKHINVEKELKIPGKSIKGAMSKKNLIKKSKVQVSQQRRDLFLSVDNSKSFKFDPDTGCWLDTNRQENEINKTLIESQKVSTGNSMKEMEELRAQTRNLEEENRLLKLKIEILMEMVTETTAELNLKDKHSEAF